MADQKKLLQTPLFSSRVMTTTPSLVLKGKLQLQEKSHEPEKKQEPALETKTSQPEEKQLQEIASDSDYHPLSPFLWSRMEKPTCPTFADVFLLSSEIENVDFDISETEEGKLADEPLSISTTPLHEPKTITTNPSSPNEHQYEVISCPKLSWKYVKKCSKIVKFYTGSPTPAAFDFIIYCLKPKHGKIQYFKGNEMKATKRYLFILSKPLCQKKPGPK